MPRAISSPPIAVVLSPCPPKPLATHRPLSISPICGTLGRAIHRMPQIGEIESGLWVASGFGGHGLNTTAMGGELIARGIVEADPTWRLFAPYELVWAGGLLGRVLAQGIYWGTRPFDRAAQELARYRESARKRRQARKDARLAARSKADQEPGQAPGQAPGQGPGQAAAE